MKLLPMGHMIWVQPLLINDWPNGHHWGFEDPGLSLMLKDASVLTVSNLFLESWSFHADEAVIHRELIEKLLNCLPFRMTLWGNLSSLYVSAKVIRARIQNFRVVYICFSMLKSSDRSSHREIWAVVKFLAWVGYHYFPTSKTSIIPDFYWSRLHFWINHVFNN